MSSVPARHTLRAGLRRLATGLIAYGAIGIGIAIVGLIATIWLSLRLGALSERTSTQMTTVVDTLDRTADVLADASASATSFAVTLERTVPVVRQVASTIGDLQANFLAIQAQLGQVEILGRQPLESVAGRFGEMATSLEGLDTRLELIATELEANKTALLDNADSLGALGEQLQSIGDQLREGGVGDRLDDVRAVVTLLALLLVVWVTIPAAGALWLGWGLRRELEPRAAPASADDA